MTYWEEFMPDDVAIGLFFQPKSVDLENLPRVERG